MLLWLDEYKRSLKLPEVEEIFDLVLFRPVAFLLVKLLLPTAITPNHVTLVAMVFGVAGAWLFSWGIPGALVGGALLFSIYNVLDCVDGQLARLKGNGTRLGRIMDGIIDYIVNIALYIFLAIGLSRTSADPVGAWILALLAGVSSGVQAILFDYYRNEFLGSVFGHEDATNQDIRRFSAEVARLRRRGIWTPRRVLITIYLLYLTVQKRLGGRAAMLHRQISPEQYYRSNKTLVRMWSFIGSTSHVTLLLVTALIHRLDLYLWITVTLGNAWMFFLMILQYRTEQALIAQRLPE
jgi:phosphatidylglycerophosphate synthase